MKCNERKICSGTTWNCPRRAYMDTDGTVLCVCPPCLAFTDIDTIIALRNCLYDSDNPSRR